MPKELKKNLYISIPFVIIAGVFAAIQGAAAKYEVQRLSAEVIFFFRFVIGFFFISLWTFSTAKPSISHHIVKTKKLKLLIFRSILGSSASLLYYVGLKYTTLSVATVLFQTIPLFVPFVVRVWLKLSIPHILWWGLSLAFIGVLFIIRPSVKGFHFSSLIALGSGILGAISSVGARVLHYTESTQKITWYYFFLSSIYALLFFVGSLFFNPLSLERADYFALAFVGLSGFLFQYLFLIAVRFSPVRLVSPFIYFSLIFTVLLDVFYFHVKPSFFEILGIGLVIVGVVLVALLYPKEEKPIPAKIHE